MTGTPTPRPRRFAWFPAPGGLDLPADLGAIRRTRRQTDPAELLSGVPQPEPPPRRRTDSMWDLVRILQARIDDLLERIGELREHVADLRSERNALREERDELRRKLGF